MANLKQLKQKRISVNKTRQVTKAMESVSAVKMRRAQERALGGRAYATGALRILNHFSQSTETSAHPLFETRQKNAVGIVIVTSDKGLAGSLNSAVLKKVSAFLSLDINRGKEIVCVCIGRRGHDFAKNRGLAILHYEENKSDDVTEDEMKRITEALLHEHTAGVTESWYMAYTTFKSTFEQTAVLRQVLPLTQSALEEVITGITPSTGKYADTDKKEVAHIAYTVEPSAEEILDAIIPNLVNIFVYHALLETKASEHSARMVAMKSATDKATEMSDALLLEFNKARQAVITSEVSEITSGIEAMK